MTIVQAREGADMLLREIMKLVHDYQRKTGMNVEIVKSSLTPVEDMRIEISMEVRHDR